MIISGNYGMISPIYDRLYMNQTIEESKPQAQAVQNIQPIQKLAPISNGVEASAGLELQDGRPQIGTTSRLRIIDNAHIPIAQAPNVICPFL